MLVRIVKMSFDPDSVALFLVNFEAVKNDIRNFKGCQYLELYRDQHNRNVFFTYSYWDSESSLNTYRNSELFNEVWAATKVLFNDRPQAWSVEKLVSLK
jgi:hypothetical protein